MCRAALVFACLAVASHGRRVQTTEKRLPPKSDEAVEGTPLDAFRALATALVASKPAAAFNPSSLGGLSPRHNPAAFSRHEHRRTPSLMQEEAVADDMGEKRIDATDGGIFTKAEFMEYYKENFEEEWAKATPAGDIKMLSELKVGMEVKATVKTVVAFGAFCDIGAEADALLHITEISDEFIEDIWEKVSEGDEYKAWIKSIDMENGRLGITAKDMANVKTLDQLNVGDTVEATVKRIMPFGAFCDIGTTTNALLHVSQICNEFISDVSEKLSEGQKLTARIREIDVANNKIAISCRDEGDFGGGPAVDPNRTPLEELQVGQEVQGTVKTVMDFGAFVDIGAQKDALLHVTEISDEYVESPSDKLTSGDQITARIKEVDLSSQRLAISCKSGDGGGDGSYGGDDGYGGDEGY